MNIIYWLVVWNMAFIFHNMNGSSFPLTNSYFSRWLKPPTRFHMEKKPSERCLFQRQATWLKGCHYWVTLYILYFFKTLKSSQEVPFMRKRRARRKFHRNSLAGLWSKIRLKSYQQIEFASQQELHWYTMVYIIIHTHTHIYI